MNFPLDSPYPIAMPVEKINSVSTIGVEKDPATTKTVQESVGRQESQLLDSGLDRIAAAVRHQTYRASIDELNGI
jgi:hypothetical protein